jgi:hypothetical protein
VTEKMEQLFNQHGEVAFVLAPKLLVLKRFWC